MIFLFSHTILCFDGCKYKIAFLCLAIVICLLLNHIWLSTTFVECFVVYWLKIWFKVLKFADSCKLQFSGNEAPNGKRSAFFFGGGRSTPVGKACAEGTPLPCGKSPRWGNAAPLWEWSDFRGRYLSHRNDLQEHSTAVLVGMIPCAKLDLSRLSITLVGKARAEGTQNIFGKRPRRGNATRMSIKNESRPKS